MAEVLDDALLAEIEGHAVEVARGAGEILNGHFGKPLEVDYKDEKKQDPVTNADRESQDFLTQAISERFPDHSILGEEDQDQEDSPAADYVWVLDPLDGTKNYLSGLPVFACSVGVLCKGSPVVGAVYVPWPVGGGVVLHAHRGGGAFVGDDPISVSESGQTGSAPLVALPAGFGAMYRLRRPTRGGAGELRVTGSIAYELAMTARGVLRYMVTAAPHLWDVAAGVVLVEEAGGLVMLGRRAAGLGSWLSGRTIWQPLETFVDDWRSGETTMEELRRWSSPIVLGSPEAVRSLTANLRTRRHLRRRMRRVARRLGPSRKDKPGRS